MPVELINQHPQVNASLLNHCRKTSLQIIRLCAVPLHHVNVVLTTDGKMAELNSHYRHKEGATNVLSFPFGDGEESFLDSISPPILGDVVISYDRAVEEARLSGITSEQRLDWLIVHGVLHLLGYDHERSEKDAAVMFDKEQELLSELKIHRRIVMPRLAVNVDHVATIRQARGIEEPDPVTAAAICELAGAKGIVVHLREDRRHIQDRDVRILRETVKTRLNLEMGAAKEIINFALEIKPDLVTLVPEKRLELTTEGGLDVVSQQKKLAKTIDKMAKASIPVSLFIDPDSSQIKAANEIGATFVELHTGRYADAEDEALRFEEFEMIRTSAEEAHLLGLRVNAGHGLNYVNTAAIAALDPIEELSIGHAIISRAVFSGLDLAVRDMCAIVENGSYY
ncbi:MAG: pyridoxine 5'-phosphate synthase [Desulfofustis sp.]|nr:pyridoxine 5'-phosphate synthase [Desulfofustis sp.]